MRTDKLVMIVAVAIITVSVLAAAATSSLLADQHPDPYEHAFGYTAEGTIDGRPYSGTASCTTVHENDSFHNYRFIIKVSDVNGTNKEDSLYLIFGKDGALYYLDRVGETTFDGERAVQYSGTINGRDYTVTVGEYCKVLHFSMAYENTVLSGTLSV